MTKARTAAPAALQARDRLIIALDVDSAERARRIVDELRGQAGAFKIGLQLFTAAGPAFVRELCEAGTKVFLDLKFHDIPNTVAKAGIEAARLGVWMFNVHALGGGEMMRHTSAEVDEFCETESMPRPRIVGVTILTSSADDTLRETGIETDVASQVARLARLAAASGLDGVVASPLEIRAIREVCVPGFLIVTPGVRPENASNDDQRRVMTPGEAAEAGADYLVVGRPITGARDMAAALADVLTEISDKTK